MTQYRYIAKTQKGEEKTGVLGAKDEFQLARVLKRKGLVLVSAQADGRTKKGLAIEIPFLNKVSLAEKMIFCRNLRVMISAGISIPRALETLALQAKSKKFKQALSEIREEILRGKSFSDGLVKHPHIFSELFVNMVKVGEESGTLTDVLEILTRQMKREYELKSNIKGAMMYPAVVIVAMVIIGILMLIMVVPNLSRTFTELGIDLPPTTQFVIWLGNTLATRWYLVFGVITLVFVLIGRASQTKNGKRVLDTISLKLPILGSLVKRINSASTARTLSSLIGAGVPLARSLEIVANALTNVYYKEAIGASVKAVRKGIKLSVFLNDYQNLYPLLIIQMIAVGEETGQTADILDKLADFLEEEVTNATKNFASVIEPVIMLLVGGAVGFFAISMIQPMYSMLEAVN